MKTTAERVKKYQQQHIAQGLCKNCSEPSIDGTMCEKHRKAHREANKRYKAKRKTQGFCSNCFQPAYLTFQKCSICLEKDSLRAKKNQLLNPNLFMLYKARQRAKTQSVLCTIIETDIVVPKICPILGIPLFSGQGVKCHNSPSLDRIIPSKGYTPDNIQVISDKANTMKQDATLEELVLLGEWAKKQINLSKRA